MSSGQRIVAAIAFAAFLKQVPSVLIEGGAAVPASAVAAVHRNEDGSAHIETHGGKYHQAAQPYSDLIATLGK